MMRLLMLCLSLAFAGPGLAAISVTVNGDTAGPVSVEVGDTVYVEVSASGCTEVNSNNSVWRDTWTNAGDPSQQVFTASPCSDTPFGRTVSFNTPGTYTVSFASEYCRNYRPDDCRSGWVGDGSDDIVVVVRDPLALTCFDDGFIGNALTPDDWVTSVSRGDFTPGIAANGRLRMTEAVSNQATAATLQRFILGAENLIILEFDYYAYGGNGADGLAIALSDAAVTPQPGSYGGSLGYAQRSNGDAGFAGGWLGIGLDEFGNFSNPTEGRIGGPGFRPDAVAIRGAAPDYRYLQGSGTLATGIDQPGNTPSPHRYRITVDSRLPDEALVMVERDLTGTGGNYQVLVPAFDALDAAAQPAVPENFLLSLTGSTGGSHNIHELDNVQLCALKLNPVGAQVDHFEIVHDGVALTCQPETVTIRACANADCSELYTEPVTATMAPTGWVGGDAIEITGGITTTPQLRKTTPGIVQMGVVGSQPATRPQSVTLCQVGSSSLSAANCSLSFASSGLLFDIPDLIANRPEAGIQVRAVRQDDVTQACVPAFANVTREVNFWSTFVTPAGAALSASPPILLSDTAVGQTAADATPLTLAFDSAGIAPINVRYAEAGQMQLNARYSGSTATGDEGLTLPGSDQFVSVPAGFCIEATEPAAACSAPYSECSVLTAAGDGFASALRAVAWESAGETGPQFCTGNAVTRNFRVPNLELAHDLIAPIPGEKGALGITSKPMLDADAGEAAFGQSISEVGVFNLRITAGQLYFGLPLPGGASSPVGRFTPAYFMIDPSMSTAGLLQASCSSGEPFSYLGQAINWAVEPEVFIRAMNRDGQLTPNYTRGGFQKLGPSGISRTLPVKDDERLLLDGSDQVPVSYSASPPTLVASSAPGVMRYRFAATDRLTYSKLENTRVEPFSPKVTFAINTIIDTDGVSALGLPEILQPAGLFDLRYGRFSLENVYGPEDVASLAMRFGTEYWNGNRYLLNTGDDCTAWSTTDIGGSSDHHVLQAASGSALVGGEGGPLTLTPLGTQGTDRLVWTVPLWLQDFWGGSTALENPVGLATFGVYRGHDRVIYWRER